MSFFFLWQPSSDFHGVRRWEDDQGQIIDVCLFCARPEVSDELLL